MYGMIVGVEIDVVSVVGKKKFSQNKSEEDRKVTQTCPHTLTLTLILTPTLHPTILNNKGVLDALEAGSGGPSGVLLGQAMCDLSKL